MLTGLFPPDASSGETTLYGHSIKSDLSSARRVLGVCPQHDVLFDSLTCREHVIFFALLKGSPRRKFRVVFGPLAFSDARPPRADISPTRAPPRAALSRPAWEFAHPRRL